jgi:hypothetical protein
MSSPFLVVPMDIAALCVGQPDANAPLGSYGTKDLAEIAADFTALPYLNQTGAPVNERANLSEQVLPVPFQTASNPLPQGIHLHWALPDALAHGSTDGQSATQFPQAPNRWLVVRLATNTADLGAPLTDLKAWVVEGDQLWDPTEANDPLPQNGLSRAVPLKPNPAQKPNKAYQTMGRVYPYETWTEGTGSAYSAQHTALGYGTPSFAAAYPHCPNVFGLYDPLDDLDLQRFPADSSKLAYAVTGWYSDTKVDPLTTITYPAGATIEQQLAAIKAAYQWTFTTAGEIPTQTLCNGLLTDITWDPTKAYLEQRPETPVAVAVGNTTAEALSALLASQPDLAGLANVERVLNLLQLNLLSRLGLPGGLGEAEEALHQSGFGGRHAGQIWVIQRKTTGNASNGPVTVTDQDLLDAARDLEASLPAALAGLLNELNITQQSYDELAWAIESRRAQIFADWYKYMLLEYPDGGQLPTTQPTANDAFQYVQAAIEELNGELGMLTGFNSAVQIQQATLAAQLGDSFLLTTVAAPRYWQANDPVVLLSGADVTPSNRHGGDGRFDRDGNLVCRLSSSLLIAMAVNGGYDLTAGALPALSKVPISSLNALVTEAFFLDPNQAAVLAQAVAAQGGTQNPASQDLRGLIQAIQQAQQGLFTPTTTTLPSVTFTGEAPSLVGFQTWAPPWIPLMLQWEAYYAPLQPVGDGSGLDKQYPADLVTSKTVLDPDAIDLLLQGAPDWANLQIYQGSLLLTPNTEIHLTDQIDRFLQYYPDDPHASELQQLRDQINLPMMAQALDGFNQALLMRKQTLQLPVSDPLAILNGFAHYKFSNITVPGAVADQNNSAPLPLNPYNPLRAGWMRIKRLRIIDAFGQVRDLVDPAVTPAESLADTSDSVITLPPRITQPARLRFRWLAASDDQVEMNTHPAASPICGWVLFNHLDQSLVLYGEDGNALGSFNLRGPFWQGAPGNNATFDQPIDQVLAGVNPHLQNFALGIYQNPDRAGFLQDLLVTMDRAATNLNPLTQKQTQGLSLLIGRPFALVRATLGLDLQGLPALNESWPAFATAVQNGDPFERRDVADFPQVQFPVRLGDLSQLSDGLVGYFVEDGTETAYQTFYAPASTATDHGVVAPGPDQLLLQADPNAAGLLLSMLLDPRAAVHATTGFLPVKKITIPPDQYAKALQQMAVTFLTSPVLSTGATFALPVPQEAGYAWSWVTNDPQINGWTVLPEIGQVTTKATLTSPQQVIEGWLKLTKSGGEA